MEMEGGEVNREAVMEEGSVEGYKKEEQRQDRYSKISPWKKVQIDNARNGVHYQCSNGD